MSIVYLPPELQASDLNCALCGVKLPLIRATAGLLGADSKQKFACVSHLFEVEKLIVGWADFISQERISHLQRNQDTASLLYGGDFIDA